MDKLEEILAVGARSAMTKLPYSVAVDRSRVPASKTKTTLDWLGESHQVIGLDRNVKQTSGMLKLDSVLQTATLVTNAAGEHLLGCDILDHNKSILRFCRDNCKGRFALLVPDRWTDKTYAQFAFKKDRDTFVGAFGGNDLKPGRAERTRLIDLNAMCE